NVYCEIYPCDVAFDVIADKKPRALILSGGPASVMETGSPSTDPRIFELDVPILGICYGQQWMFHMLGGKVEKAIEREYGPASLHIKETRGLFSRFSLEQETPVWMSHGDRVVTLPSGFSVIGITDNSPFAAVADHGRRYYGVQFHPEVMH